MPSSSQLPPAQPKSILRGHQAPVHTAAFVRGNRRLASGVAEGYVVLWDLTIMRPRAVWRAHANAILGLAAWGSDRIITHGRDNQLIVWNITADDEPRLSTALPLDPSPGPRPQPWVLHILTVNTMNFCSFASCPASANGTSDEILVAVPNTLESEAVDIYHLPSQDRLHTVPPSSKDKNGMVMALALFHKDASLTLVTAYENGLATVVQQDDSGQWNLLYRAQAHSQPILSLDVSCGHDFFVTTSADALLVKHPVPSQSKSASTFAPPPAAVGIERAQKAPASASLLSESLSRLQPVKPSPKRGVEVETEPLKVANTKHAGQQSLRIRSDGKIFATAGWDAKVRVYSVQNMRELAVLKWHQSGCYAVAFAALGSSGPEPGETEPSETSDAAGQQPLSLVPQTGDLTVKERRIKQANEAHWLAAGSKDGKISLWDIY